MSYTPSANELHAYLQNQIAIGYYDSEWLVEEAVHMFTTDEATVRPLAAQLTTKLEQEMASWPEVTDCQRLDAAFEALNRAGIRARQHFACCNTCGHSELREDIHLARELGATIDGYVFYHRQDAEAVVTTGTLTLRYATLCGEPDEERALGQQILGALREQGLSPVWECDSGPVIELRDFRWQRSDWPDEADEKPEWTTAQALEAWTTQMMAMSASSFMASLGFRFATELANVGCLDTLRAWARAPLTDAPTLATLANLLRSDELWREAFARVSYGRRGELVEVLLEAPLNDPALRRIARTRALIARPDLCGTAALAWYLVRSPEDDPALLERVMRQLAHLDADTSDPSPRLALDAALWLIHARRGEADAAKALRERILTTVQSHHYRYRGPDFARSAVVAAARVHDDHALLELLLGPPLPSALGEAEAHLAKVEEDYTDGLGIYSDMEAAETNLFWRRIEHGDCEFKLRELIGLARKNQEEIVASGSEVRAQLEDVSNGEPLPAILASDRPSAPVAKSKLDRHIARWSAATDRAARQKAQSAGQAILQAAIALAEQGEVERARALIELVLDADDCPVVNQRTAMVAWLALGELERAVAFAENCFVGCEALAPLVVRLAEAERSSEALKWLCAAFRYVSDRHRITLLAPAVLAVAGNQRAAATAMVATWARADASLDALLPGSPFSGDS